MIDMQPINLLGINSFEEVGRETTQGSHHSQLTVALFWAVLDSSLVESVGKEF